MPTCGANIIMGGLAASGMYYAYDKRIIPRTNFLGTAEELLWGVPASEPQLRNEAFVFVKPAANTEEVKALIKGVLAQKGINVSSEGEISAAEIDAKRLIDQHYYAIMCKADILKPSEMNVPADVFEKKFGSKWSDVLNNGLAFNASDACRKLKISSDELNKYFSAAKKAGNVAKLGGGFYCGKVEVPGSEPIFVFNGFYSSMRKGFTSPGTSIYYFTVDFDPKKTNWEHFRDNILGTTDPAASPQGSLRREVLDNWRELGLKSEPTVGENAVHASASPFEGLAERMNWLNVPIVADRFGSYLVEKGVSPKTVSLWSRDPQVKGKSLFDQLENLDAAQCADKAASLASTA
ncbi:Flagellar Member 1 [Diplonema papillatum]|nr:Flagellar Member 1 [Diplonema papillatum]